MAKIKEATKPDLGGEKIPTLLRKLAIPAIVAQLVNLLYNMVDRIYIGHIPEVGKDALTGLGLCFAIMMLVNAFTMLVSSGGAPRAAIAMGKGNTEEAERILGNCASMIVIASLVLVTVLELWAEPLLRFFGASDVIMPYAISYMRIYVAGTACVMCSMGLNLFITAQGFASISMKTVMIGAVLNLILDPIFIFGFHMGVSGAATATIISQTVSAIWVLHFLRGKSTVLRLKKENMKLDKSIVLPVLALGIAPFIMTFTESIMNVAFNSSLSKYGGDVAVGSMTILVSVLQLQQLPLLGLCQGGQTIMSFNFGARQNDRVRETYKILFAIVFVWSMLFWLLVELNPSMFVLIFNKESEELIATASWGLRIYMFAFGIFNLQLVCQQSFVGLGQAKYALIIACLRKVVLLIPLIYILPNFFADKTFAVLLAEPVADFISVTVAMTLFVLNIHKILEKGPSGT